MSHKKYYEPMESNELLPGVELNEAELHKLMKNIEPVGSGPLGVMRIAWRLGEIIARQNGWTMPEPMYKRIKNEQKDTR